MSFREYLKESLTVPTFDEFKQNLKANKYWLFAVLVGLCLLVYFEHINYPFGSVFVGLGIATVGWANILWDDYQEWRVKHGS